MNVETINYLLALATLAAQIVGAGFLALYFLRMRFPDLADVARFLETRGLWTALVFAAGGSALTLFYSEILGFAPCGLCWLQRVFLYPQILLFALAIYKRDRAAADYSIALSIVGGATALYQHYLQMGGVDVLPCPATLSQATDCASRFLFELGYITFPLMSATLFALLIILMLFVRQSGRSS